MTRAHPHWAQQINAMHARLQSEGDAVVKIVVETMGTMHFKAWALTLKGRKLELFIFGLSPQN